MTEILGLLEHFKHLFQLLRQIFVCAVVVGALWNLAYSFLGALARAKAKK